MEVWFHGAPVRPGISADHINAIALGMRAEGAQNFPIESVHFSHDQGRRRDRLNQFKDFRPALLLHPALCLRGPLGAAS
jgi:hypothetical protein